MWSASVCEQLRGLPALQKREKWHGTDISREWERIVRTVVVDVSGWWCNWLTCLTARINPPHRAASATQTAKWARPTRTLIRRLPTTDPCQTIRSPTTRTRKTRLPRRRTAARSIVMRSCHARPTTTSSAVSAISARLSTIQPPISTPPSRYPACARHSLRARILTN